MEVRREEQDELSMKNSIEITGVPEEENEDVFEIIKKVGQGLGIKMIPEMVNDYYRSKRTQDTEDKPRSIIVKLAKRKHKEDFLQKRRLKRILRAKDLELSGDSFIYITESLSEECRKVLDAARAVKRAKGFKYLWVRNGRVLLRKEENGNVITLTTLEQVAAL